jgi:hypothetical protein
MMAKNEVWAICELMGHLTLAGRVMKPGENGGLWQIDIPEGESFRTEFFGSQSVYRIRIVSEEIARAYSHKNEVIEYNAPIVTREQHEAAMDHARELLQQARVRIRDLQQELSEVRALPPGEEAESDGDYPSPNDTQAWLEDEMGPDYEDPFDEEDF